MDENEHTLIPYQEGDSVFFRNQEGKNHSFVVSEIDKRFDENCKGSEKCCEYYAEELIQFHLIQSQKLYTFDFYLRQGRSLEFEEGETEFTIQYYRDSKFYLYSKSATVTSFFYKNKYCPLKLNHQRNSIEAIFFN